MTSIVPRTRPARAGWRPTLAISLGLAFLAAACSSGTGATFGPDAGAGQPGATAAPAGQPTGGGAGANNVGNATGGSGSGGSGDGASAPADAARIVRTGSIRLTVEALDQAIDAARDAILDVGGYISGSRRTSDGDRSVAEVTYRIPTDRWEESLVALRRLGEIVGEETGAVEVTGQLIDLGARIRNLQASEASLQGIAESATTVSDLLLVQQRLSDVRGEIERMQAQLSDLSNRAALGTLTAIFGLQVEAVVEAARGWNAATEVDAASAELIGIGQRVAGAGIWFGIVWLPVLIVLGLLALLGARVVRATGLARRPERDERTWSTAGRGGPTSDT